MTKSKSGMDYTGERFVPEAEGEVALEHLHRYLQAREYVGGKEVLDIASGEGYGSALLAGSAAKVTGVDISEEAVQHARQRYVQDNLEYLLGDCAAIPMADASVDVVVSFETIEHHDEHEKMMDEIVRVLRPNGLLIISSPDKLNYSDIPGYDNPYHVKELYRHEFEALLASRFKYVVLAGQRVIYGSCIFSDYPMGSPNSYWIEGDKYSQAEGVTNPVYLVALASNVALPEMSSGFLEQPVEECESVLAWKKKAIQVGDELATIRQIVEKRDDNVDELYRMVGARDTRIEELYSEIGDRDNNISSLTQMLGARNDQIGDELAAIRQIVEKRADNIDELYRMVGARDTRIEELYSEIGDRDSNISSLTQMLGARNDQIAGLERQFHELMSSRSVRWTKPLRILKNNLLFKSDSFARRTAALSAKFLWNMLPVSESAKLRLKGSFFSVAPRKFARTASYQRWLAYKASQEEPPFELDGQAIEFVPLLDCQAVQSKPAKLICFYLPQFHPIPENNEWWGDGFTEWTNVKPAQPQFEGHYQPHIPGELGYYNLLDSSVQRRQLELAKTYGIEGFCFYFYWFGGKRLLDQPIQNYLGDPSLDHPFCLCWANENWSRRWDGFDNEILIAQQHSAEDDLAFIEHVSQYMKDSRYIRIDGRPLLLVYRPGLLPSPKSTVVSWRMWCRDNGIGEIYLAYTQSFEAVDPSEYGFDAAIEFPPNNSALSRVDDSVTPVGSDFDSAVYDWRELVARSRSYISPKYKLFRGVNPAWDNTARRKNKASILLHSSPVGYQEWLHNAIVDTRERFDNPDERLIFINAWNEWAEGAHLEPDQRYGYAYLEATRVALCRSAPKTPSKPGVLAIVIHAYYEDIFGEIIARIKVSGSVRFKLFVTTPLDLQGRVDAALKATGFEYLLLPVNNHGRDLLPFMKIVRAVVKEGFDYLLKIHTKKSKHRSDGAAWRADLYDKMLTEDAMHSAMAAFDGNPEVGLIGPDGHIVPMATYWGANRYVVESLAHRLGQRARDIQAMHFIAGSMFFARTRALAPLLNLAISDADFESEAGQVDGTFAHALERAISISSESAGLRTISTAGKFLSNSNDDYQFADKA